MDGMLIAIQQPKGLYPGETQSFMTRKGYYALNTMVVRDGDMKILDIDPCFPGSCHDSFVWRHTPLRSRLETVLRPGEIVLGVSGYPPEPWILTPVPGHPATDTPEGRYNRAHASNVVESPEKGAVIVAACAALQNIVLEAGEPCIVADDDDDDDVDDVVQVALQPTRARVESCHRNQGAHHHHTTCS
ncbi:putative nuclease HARBI1 [Dermacentor albipictus]|uniref:putative nuclease HARBI1 n=1 Tax=Dermacentor albipictus TaxID=60249 RepID=UPI0031FE28F0